MGALIDVNISQVIWERGGLFFIFSEYIPFQINFDDDRPVILGDLLHQADALTGSSLGRAPRDRVVLDNTLFWEKREGFLLVWGPRPTILRAGSYLCTWVFRKTLWYQAYILDLPHAKLGCPSIEPSLALESTISEAENSLKKLSVNNWVRNIEIHDNHLIQ